MNGNLSATAAHPEGVDTEASSHWSPSGHTEGGKIEIRSDHIQIDTQLQVEGLY